MMLSTEKLFSLLSSPDFRAMRGLATETPLFVLAYEPQEEDHARQTANALHNRLNASGVATETIDLFGFVLEWLDTAGRLTPILEREAALSKTKLLDLFRSLTDPSGGPILKALLARLTEPGPEITLITGVGRVFPFLRAHTVLEAIQPAMSRHPIILFFPGRYVHTDNGSQLQLFGNDVTPPLSKNHYRAINLADYHL